MADYGLADDVAAHLRRLGYRGPAKPEAFRKLCTGDTRPLFEFLLETVRPKAEVESARANILVVAAARNANKEDHDRVSDVLRQEEEEVTAEVKELRAREAQLRDRIRRRTHEMMSAEARRSVVVAKERDAAFQASVLRAYDEKCRSTLRVFQEYKTRLGRLLERAKKARQSFAEIEPVAGVPTFARPRNEEEEGEAAVLESACEVVAEALLEHISLHNPAYAGAGDLDAPGEGAACFTSFSLPSAATATAEARAAAPARLVRDLAAITAAATKALSEETDAIDFAKDAREMRLQGDPAAASGGGGGASELVGGGPKGPNELLRERQTAHVDRFMFTEAALNEADKLRNAFNARKHDLEACAAALERAGGASAGETRRLNQLQLELVGTLAAVDALKEEAGRLAASKADRSKVEAALRRKWTLIQSFEARSAALDRLGSGLVQANLDTVSGWGREAAAAQAFVERSVGPLSDELSQRVGLCAGGVARETGAFNDVPLRLLRGGEGAGAHTAVPAGPGAPTGRRAPIRGDPSTLPVLERWAAAMAGPRMPGWVPADGQLAAVLQACGPVLLPSPGALAPERALASIEDTRRAAEAAAEAAKTARSRLQGLEARAAREEALAADLEGRVAAADASAVGEQVPHLEKNTKLAVTAAGAVEGVRAAMDEWWEQPAATAVPWVKVKGRNVEEWVNEIRRLQA